MTRVKKNIISKSSVQRTSFWMSIVILIGFFVIIKYFGIPVLQQRYGLNQAKELGSSTIVQAK